MKPEWKKVEKKFYLPETEPGFIKIPPFKFFTIEGKGDPNDKFFSDYIGVLYSLSYTVKMSPKNGFAPTGYFEYTVYPLEGIWDISEAAKKLYPEKPDKSSFVFNLMIRQPDFVTEDFASEIIERTKKKKPDPLLEKVKFDIIDDSDCVQMMHIGSYDDEQVSFKKIEDFCLENNFTRESKIHREIYLSNPGKVSPDRLKTVLRFKIKK